MLHVHNADRQARERWDTCLWSCAARHWPAWMQADSDSEDLDSATPPPGTEGSNEPSAFDAAAGSKQKKDGKPALRKYIESFDQATLRETATLMSREGASLLDRQTKALWGDAHELQAEMQKVRAPALARA
jgi:hypothetical protein